MNALPVEELLTPLGADQPCGADMEYDPAFLAADEASRGKPEQQFGDNIIPAKDPEWLEVFNNALDVARRTRDVRVAVWLARSGARLHGIGAYVSGAGLVAGLLETFWDSVYPKLDADDNNDPTMRLNALAPLVDADAGIADLRAAVIGSGRNAITVRQLELAAGKADALPGESVPTPAGIVQALVAIENQRPGTLALLRQLQAEVVRIENLLIDKVGGATGPEMKPLRALAQSVAQLAAQAEGGIPAADGAHDGGTDVGSAGAQASGGAPGALRTRDDVNRSLDRACEWLERNEPGNPAPLLIRRAQRLMGKNFLDIIRDLAPAGLDQVENIAGNSNQ
jgi:type VI secretion system protein ImpA